MAEPTVPSHQPRVTGTDTRNPLQPHAQVLAVRLIPPAGIADHLRREDRAAFRQIDAQPFGPWTGASVAVLIFALVGFWVCYLPTVTTQHKYSEL